MAEERLAPNAATIPMRVWGDCNQADNRSLARDDGPWGCQSQADVQKTARRGPGESDPNIRLSKLRAIPETRKQVPAPAGVPEIWGA